MESLSDVQKHAQNETIRICALIALAGYLLSGPIGFAVVQLVDPQPLWTDAQTFVAHYTIVQDIPYYCGFLLVGGTLALVAAVYVKAGVEHRFYALMALMSALVFAALILFNYICQTTFVRSLALHYNASYDPLIATFSMANPLSLSWAIEFWGYGMLGCATLFIYIFYPVQRRLTRVLLLSNGIVSLAAVILTIYSSAWVLTTTGLISYMLWNLLMIVLMTCVIRDHSVTARIVANE